MELGFEVEQLVFLGLYHLVYRNAGPARHDVGYVLRVDFLLYEGLLALHHAQLFLNRRVFFFLFLNARIADFGYLGIISLTLGTLGIKVKLLDVDFVLLNLVNQFFFCPPFGRILLLVFAQLGKFTLDILDFFLVALALYGLALDFLLCNLA